MSFLSSIKQFIRRKDITDFSSKYSVLKKNSVIGNGGNGDVRKATNIETGEFVALKCLNKDAKKIKEKVLRFEDEIKTMIEAGKQVKGIIPIIDYSTTGCWYVMPIAESIKKHCTNVEEIVDGIIQIAESLAEIHRIGFSHRDIKPDNMLFYDNRWVLCDFGLVDIPDNPHHLTKNSNRIGAIRTIAPEMSRNAKDADGQKADVYSLAKSLWMLLTNNDESFEGHYNVIDDSMSLHQYEKLRDAHLVEIDELMESATRNDPVKRPTMVEFVKKLEEWKEVKNDARKQQISNWNFLKEYALHGVGAQRCTWENPVEILRVLNILSMLPLYSHIFFPDKGWVEFRKVEIGSEPGTLDFYTTFLIYRIKLGSFHYEGFFQSEWNYFMLEAEPMVPVVGVEADDYCETVVEDTPGHFVSAIDAMYGVYNYDSGEKLPVGARLLKRCLKGKFLIVLKQGPYNLIPQTDDGRHANCSNDKFREYIETLQKLYLLHGLVDEKTWKIMYETIVDRCPFKPEREMPEPDEIAFKSDKEYVRNNWSSFDFSSVLEQYDNVALGKAKYRFVFHQVNSGVIDWLFTNKEYYLCKDGSIRELPNDSSDIFEATDRESVVEICKALKAKVENICNGIVYEFEQPYFTVEIIKVSSPAHLFTKEDIRKLMVDADDRVNNILVIDEDGHAHIIQNYDEAKCYPVVNETWCGRRKYVGRYSSLSDLEPSYHYSLGKFRDYLKSGLGQPRYDYDPYCESTEELINEIKRLSSN